MKTNEEDVRSEIRDKKKDLSKGYGKNSKQISTIQSIFSMKCYYCGYQRYMKQRLHNQKTCSKYHKVEQLERICNQNNFCKNVVNDNVISKNY